MRSLWPTHTFGHEGCSGPRVGTDWQPRHKVVSGTVLTNPRYSFPVLMINDPSGCRCAFGLTIVFQQAPILGWR